MSASTAADPVIIAASLQQAFGTIRRTIPHMGTDQPMIGNPDLTYVRSKSHFWVESFWSGQLWLAFAETGDAVFFDAARAQQPYFAERLNEAASHDHDLGFLYTLSAVADYKLTGDPEARRMGLVAAEYLAARFNSAGQFICAWNDRFDQATNSWTRLRGKMIVDCMENLGLLFWAANETNQSYLRDIAIAHAETTARYIVRPDGSTYHSYDFDPISGEPLRGVTVQGFADESCWSRGQAWAIHGFANAFAYTNLPLFRETACRLADYVLAHLPADAIPYWDYRLPDSAPQYRDSSAAAITAAGLFFLADNLDDDQRAGSYRSTATRILHSLIADYTTSDTPHAEGLLLHGAGHVNQGMADTMLPYGDYFYVEALLRALGRRQFFW